LQYDKYIYDARIYITIGLKVGDTQVWKINTAARIQSSVCITYDNFSVRINVARLVAVNSDYGFKDDASSLDDEGGEVDETVQKDHSTLNRLKREVGEFKEETQNNTIDLRSTLIINDLLASENVIVVEASKWSAINNVAPGPITPLFDVFDKIKKLNGNLFHFGKCTKIDHNSKDKVVDLLRDSTIYVSIYLRVKLDIYFGESEDVMFYLSKNHESDLKSAVLVPLLLPFSARYN